VPAQHASRGQGLRLLADEVHFTQQNPEDFILIPARQVSTARAEARHLGLALTAADVRRQFPLSIQGNAAPTYRQALRLIPASKESDGQALTDYLEPGRPAAQRQAAQAVLARSGELLRLAQAAARQPVCNFERDYAIGVDLPFPEFAGIRQLARLVAAQSVAKIETNDPMGALAAVRTGILIAQHAGQETLLIPYLVRVAILQMIDRPFREVLRQYGNRAEVLSAAADIQHLCAGLTNPRNALRSEPYFGVDAITKTRQNKPTEMLDLTEITSRLRGPATLGIFCDAWEKRLLDFWIAVAPEMNRSGSTHRTNYQTISRVAAEHDRKIAVKPRDVSYTISAIMNPVYTQAWEKAMQAEAIIRIRGVSIELLRQKAATGRLPDRLPQTNGASDPFTDRPLLYRHSGSGFIVYSVSRNGKDDGGSEAKDKEKFALDIAFRYP
jgi:hypothetical protein